ncbi:hypothetical protein BTR14_22475 [Rhizobium rhizosphaerae]|uniref:Cyclic di-GMP-binding protein n=1 Tax=Xaviernesmea rhizosphaerae TaxID=1672749 RepID=A0ABX3P6Q7_9HYPH|nr:cellulose biosynthesis cyclic di-GMP-binding regulatory protein BcsB [Xaviernesmea rhizosphaerae]OQP83389.1 hypothetical protein BTR14_22475 [Xaviernesmea rhizosphaerae]
MKRTLLACLLATALPAILPTGLAAQTLKPFDMTPERPADVQPAPGMPAVVPAPAAPVIDPTTLRRPFLPFEKLTLAGEDDRRSFTVSLTAEQAAAAQTITLGYQNAIVIAPESSRLSVTINNVTLGETPIASSDGVTGLALAIPAGVLQPGANVVTIAAHQRHRTDCTIQSTFDLWTDIRPQESFITFAAPLVGRLTQLNDLAAVAPDVKGRTAITIVAPAMASSGSADMLMRLAQALSLRVHGANQTVTVRADLPPVTQTSGLTVFLGTQSELADLVPTLPATAASGPALGYVPLPMATAGSSGAGPTALVVSGPTPRAVQTALDRLLPPADAATERHSLATASFHAPDAPLLTGEAKLALSRFGLTTTETTGRRMRTEFLVGLPDDFYASAYGQAELLLDAAYSSAVRPGSRVNIYVNGDITTTAPIAAGSGGLMQHLPIRLSLRHFAPGVNTVAIEAVLVTDEDAVCATGTPAQTKPRFALFDTTEFHMPDFARIATSPNLAATVGMSAPYGEDQPRPTALYLDRPTAESLSAAATLAGRLAMSAGKPIPLETVGSPEGLDNRNALIVGTLAQLPPALVAQMKVATAAQANWGDLPTHAIATAPSAIDSWRGQVSGTGLVESASRVNNWLRRNLDLSLDQLHILPQSETVYQPPRSADLIMAQAESPQAGGIWTLATAPTPKDLERGMAALTAQALWNKVSGRVAALDSQTATVATLAPQDIRLTPTQPFSIGNWRLIAANWMSTNILYFALLFLAAFAILGVITTLLLRGLGRRHG